MVVLRLHLDTVVIEVSGRLSWRLSVPLLSEPLEQLADWVVFGNGESHLVPLVLLLPLHVRNLSEDYLQGGESVHEDDVHTEATFTLQ